MMDKVFFSFFRCDVELLCNLVSDLCPLYRSVQQFPNASGCFIQSVEAFQVTTSLTNRNENVLIADFPENDGVTFFE